MAKAFKINPAYLIICRESRRVQIHIYSYVKFKPLWDELEAIMRGFKG